MKRTILFLFLSLTTPSLAMEIFDLTTNEEQEEKKRSRQQKIETLYKNTETLVKNSQNNNCGPFAINNMLKEVIDPKLNKHYEHISFSYFGKFQKLLNDLRYNTNKKTIDNTTSRDTKETKNKTLSAIKRLHKKLIDGHSRFIAYNLESEGPCGDNIPCGPNETLETLKNKTTQSSLDEPQHNSDPSCFEFLSTIAYLNLVNKDWLIRQRYYTQDFLKNVFCCTWIPQTKKTSQVIIPEIIEIQGALSASTAETPNSNS